MTEAGLPELAICTFRHYFAQLLDGGSGQLGEDRIGPISDVEALGDLAGRLPPMLGPVMTSMRRSHGS